MSDKRAAADVDYLLVPEDLWAEVMDHFQDALPNEGVGLVGVVISTDGDRRVSTVRSFHPGRNTRRSASRFELDVRDLVAGLKAIEDAGQELGAIVHSHPRGEPRPSRTDLAEAFYPEALMVIVSFAGDVPVARAWKLEGGEGDWRPAEVPILLA
jgi:proteasome lid subunit RPN8/RPN11